MRPAWLLLSAACITHTVAGASPLPGDQESIDTNLARMTLSLTSTRPPEFLLRYEGRNLPFRGLLCYHFGGYNETCIEPRIEWLTPATRIHLPAPGGVPREFLTGYVALVRYPMLSDALFRYPMPAAADDRR